jgi:hypothetical protein
MAKKEKKTLLSERILWWSVAIGSFFCVISAVPMVPWRYARVDTNIGDRFVMERHYTLFGATDNFGKRLGWFSLKTKIQRKSEEFGRPSPLSALLGTVTSAVGAGGAAVGCSMWQACKTHISERALAYSSIAISGIASFLLILIGALLGIGTVLAMSMEGDGSKKKKKKKKSDDSCSCEPLARTMIFSIIAFLFPTTGVTVFVLVLGMALEDFKNTAYYPFAGSHAGPFIGGVGCFLNFCGMVIAINRVHPFCGKKNAEDANDEEFGGWGEGAYGGGYGGAPPGAYGGAPPGDYGPYGGAPPGAYGGYGEAPGYGGKGGAW